MQIISWLLPALAIAVSLGVLGLCLRLAGQVKRLKQRLDDQTGKIENELCVIMEGALGLVARLQELNKEYTELSAKQLSLESRNPANFSHDQAVRMVAQGAGVDELVQYCGLPRSEAELLVMLNRDGLNRPVAPDNLQIPEDDAYLGESGNKLIGD